MKKDIFNCTICNKIETTFVRSLSKCAFFLFFTFNFITLQTFNLGAQGVTKYGESTTTSTNFVDKNGKIGSSPALGKYGQVFATLTTTAASAITSTTATSGGDVTSDGGATVTARGVCWSTSTSPTTALSTKTSDGTGTGVFTSSITGITLGNTYYVRAYATNSAGTAYGNEVSFIALAIGDSYQGGIVAYILQSGDPGYDVNVQQGLIAAPTDQSSGTGIQWYNGTFTTTGATATALGTGNANTNTIVTNQGAGSYAAQLCADLVLDGYSDWYLPSIDELAKIYLNRAAIGGFASENYWSSSEYEYDYNFARRQYFFDGSQYYDAKHNLRYVRAIRSFPFVCGGNLTINHTIGTVAPETKSVIYGTVTTSLSGTGKCWITQNLGSTNQATSATDATDASAGWYWQFNLKQGYKHDGSTLTPAWTITSISETSDWLPANDPCTIELGTGWRIPTYTEWTAADATGSWASYTNTYASVLKLHAAGSLYYSSGSLVDRGTDANYWSGTQSSTTNGRNLHFSSGNSSVTNYPKAWGFSLRCLRD